MRGLCVAAAVIALVVAGGARAGTDVDGKIRAFFGVHAATALCESHAEDPNRGPAQWSATHDVGLFQIHVDYGAGGRLLGAGHPWARYFTIAELETVDGNIRAASILSNHGAQWDAWTGTYGRGLCHGLG